jgi:predicted metalloprotease with PDZ domain
VYGFDMSVRASHVDGSHAFFNGSSVFLAVENQAHRQHHVEIVQPQGESFAAWRVATTLTARDLSPQGFGTYVSKDFDELIDHPVEIGTFQTIRFMACGTPHEFVLTGTVPNLDAKRLASDVKRICEFQIRLFEPFRQAAPFARYLFLTTAIGEGYGGLEHRASTALLCSRDDLPRTQQSGREESYQSFLGLVSHEYFHSWNVKRIKPAAFVPYALERENYTRLLWIFEGFTSYYDDLVLVRTGLLSESQYLAALGKTINEVNRVPGAKRQSVAESSFDAWIKYYRQDENSPNAIVSYYRKGALIALALDLRIRQKTHGKRSLDDVMRHLWQKFGVPFDAGQEVGVGEGEFAGLVEAATGVDVVDDVAHWAYGTGELPLAELIAPFGLKMEWERSAIQPGFGAKFIADTLGCRILNAYEGEAAQRAGLSANDVLIAVDGLRVTYANLSRVLKRYAAGQRVVVHAFRRDELRSVTLQFDEEPPTECRLVTDRINRLRSAWLKEPA